ncbi:hypothetical protein AVEN_200853-1 [Araneus ventricosus]|uniref:RNase H type-1 domain-containing protein n=1 Tax=Araneus ventricosus TaxID=182803 RepID=A0A4Y2UNV3_ARAVE|nr:hypothetical protein AVEN_200853-1 [Araneus ventricosus]
MFQTSCRGTLTCARCAEVGHESTGCTAKKGVGSTFCVFGEQQGLIAQWQGRLSPKNSIFQAELIALQEAVKYAQNHQNQVKIWSDSQPA